MGKIQEKALEYRRIQEATLTNREFQIFQAAQLKIYGPQFWKDFCLAVQHFHQIFNQEFPSDLLQIQPVIKTPSGLRLHRGHYPAVDVTAQYNTQTQTVECSITVQPKYCDASTREWTFPLQFTEAGHVECVKPGMENHTDLAEWFFEPFYPN